MGNSKLVIMTLFDALHFKLVPFLQIISYNSITMKWEGQALCFFFFFVLAKFCMATMCQT